ncbi:protein NATD1 isoform X3 [Emydura macquarii macquarii]
MSTKSHWIPKRYRGEKGPRNVVQALLAVTFHSCILLLLLSGCHDRAVLLYEYVGKRIVDLQHTEVPDAYRGRGIAKHLAKAALDFVVEEDLRAHLTC